MFDKYFYLCGYYGMKNSGDDALLLSTILGARKYLQADYFLINSPIKINFFEDGCFPPQLKSRESFRGENRIRQCLSSLKSTRIIFGGGSVLHCQRDINTKRLMMKLAGKGPHIAIGVGIGPFKNCAAEKSCAIFLNECAYIGVRDQASFLVAKNISPNANVELTFDLAPMLSCKLNNNLFNDQPRRGIAVALCPTKNLLVNTDFDRQRLKQLSRALITACRESGDPLFLIDMNGHSIFGDERINDQLQYYLPKDIPVFRLPYDPNPIRLMAYLKRMKVVVAMRLHGSILSYMVETPVISINYHSKCNGWCQQIGMPEEYQFNAGSIDENQFSTVLINGLESGFSPCQMAVCEATAASLKNFKKSQVF